MQRNTLVQWYGMYRATSAAVTATAVSYHLLIHMAVTAAVFSQSVIQPTSQRIMLI